MSEILDKIGKSEELVIELQKLLTSCPAISPESGGVGEMDKFEKLKTYLSDWGFDQTDEYFADDPRVPSGKRPSLVCTVKGTDTSKSLWIISHLDVVPPGDETLWNTPPFTATVKGDKIYGRGVEDNQQGLVSSLVAVRHLIDSRTVPPVNVKLLFVADEEVGSEYGIIHLLNNTDIFKREDLILTPDVGDPEGKFIEVAEKSILWMEFNISGKQSHGSRPDLGINAAKASSLLNLKLDKLHDTYSRIDKLFDIPYSTFEATKRIGSVTNFNTIPGSETLGYDCRVIPCYDLNDVIANVYEIVKKVEKKTGVSITMRIAQKVQSPEGTPVDSNIVKLLKNSIKRVTGADAVPYGIGGGTVAAYFRMRGIHAALWSTVDNTMHSPNEYSSIRNTLTDAKVFYLMMTGNK